MKPAATSGARHERLLRANRLKRSAVSRQSKLCQDLVEQWQQMFLTCNRSELCTGGKKYTKKFHSGVKADSSDDFLPKIAREIFRAHTFSGFSRLHDISKQLIKTAFSTACTKSSRKEISALVSRLRFELSVSSWRQRVWNSRALTSRDSHYQTNHETVCYTVPKCKSVGETLG